MLVTEDFSWSISHTEEVHSLTGLDLGAAFIYSTYRLHVFTADQKKRHFVIVLSSTEGFVPFLWSLLGFKMF